MGGACCKESDEEFDPIPGIQNINTNEVGPNKD